MLVVATSWRFTPMGDRDLLVPRRASLTELSFYGPGPVTIGEPMHASRDIAEVFDNWKGGNSFGSAFVTKDAPATPSDSSRFAGLYRVVPRSASATSAAGLWLTGQSLPGAAYITITRSRAGDSDPDLVEAMILVLRDHSALTWMSSGNRVMDSVAVDMWMSLSEFSPREKGR